MLDLGDGIGAARAGRILDIVRIVGYEIAMRRLLDAKPIVEVDAEPRTSPQPAPAPATSRASTA